MKNLAHVRRYYSRDWILSFVGVGGWGVAFDGADIGAGTSVELGR